MPTVLILDDDDNKTRRIIELLKASGCNDGEVRTVKNVVDAIGAIKADDYQIALVDLFVPMRPNQRPDRAGGIRFIRELQRLTKEKVPSFVVGITAFEDVAEEQVTFFSEHLFGLVVYDITSDAWERALRNLVAHAIAAGRPGNKAPLDLAIVCALDDPELREILALPIEWQRIKDISDPTEYHVGEIECGKGRRRVLAASMAQMGMPASAALTMKIGLKWAPRYVAMIGIAAAVEKELSLGDVVLADPAWDYGSGKVNGAAKGKELFDIEPWQLRVDPMIRTQFRAISSEEGMLDEIRRSWRGAPSKSVLKLRSGPVGSGAAVIASSAMRRNLQKQNRKIQAIDMESYGVMLAASQCPIPAPSAFSLKGISDYADEKKDDKARHYASFTSAQILLKWAQTYL